MREGKYYEKQTILAGVIYGESESRDLAGILLYYYASCC